MHVVFVAYPDVEPIDLAAIGVVSMARRVIPEVSYEIVAERPDVVRFANGLRILPDRTFDDVDEADVVLVPGGPGWRNASNDPALIAFIRRLPASTTICSVCTGAMILAEAGVLNGRRATTKVEVVSGEESPLRELQERFPDVLSERALVVDTGPVVTGGGVTLCIDTVLHLLERRFGSARADDVARIIEYGAASAANRARFGHEQGDRGPRPSATGAGS